MPDFHSQIDHITKQFQSSFGSLNTGQLNWKPNPKTWSIAQNIDHLIVINNTYLPVLDALRNGTLRLPFTARIGFLVSFFGKMILKASGPDRRRRIKTFPIWEPAVSEIPKGILDRFEEHQQALKALITNAQDLIDQGAVIHSPANKNIVYKLEKAFEIIVAHELRHLEQAKEVLKQIEKQPQA